MSRVKLTEHSVLGQVPQAQIGVPEQIELSVDDVGQVARENCHIQRVKWVKNKRGAN